MDGDAGVESQPGWGSTFWFTAWLRQDPATAPGPGPGPGPAPAPVEGDRPALLRQRHGGARVLLAEDNEVNRELALYWLRDLAQVCHMAPQSLMESIR